LIRSFFVYWGELGDKIKILDKKSIDLIHNFMYNDTEVMKCQ